MVAIQMVSALVGRVTGKGLASNMGQVIAAPAGAGAAGAAVRRQHRQCGADLAAMAKRRTWSPH